MQVVIFNIMAILKHAFSLMAGLLVAGSVGAVMPAGAATTVDIAAHQQVFEDDGSTKFIGDVKVAYLDYRIAAPEAKVELGADGQPSVAVFYPRPKAHYIDPTPNPLAAGSRDDLEADIIRLFLNDNRMKAEGNAVSYVTTVAANPVKIKSAIQEFDNNAKIMKAHGDVWVDYNGTIFTSPHATLWMGSGSADKVLFSDGATAAQKNTNIVGRNITIMPKSGNMVAEGSVVTKVNKPGKNVKITSAYQQYDKASDTMLASGGVRINYGSYKTNGPKATFKMSNGDVDKIYLTGRSKIVTNDGREVEADSIVITTKPEHFDAKGNVKTKFIAKQQPAAATRPKPAVKTASKTTLSVGSSSKKDEPKQPVIEPDAPTDDYL
jgi:lipopolysaccharide export system protein LptA